MARATHSGDNIMLTRYQFLMGKIAEEASEISHRAAKCQQFGPKEAEPGQQFCNDYRLWKEIQDLWAVLELVSGEGNEMENFDKEPFTINVKKDKIEKFYQYSQSLGMVQ